MAPLRCAAKFDPFLSLDCATRPSTLAQLKEGRDQILPSGNLVGDNNRTDIEDCRSFCQEQASAAFFTFNDEKQSCGCRATKGESGNVQGAHSGTILDLTKLDAWRGQDSLFYT